MNVTDAKNDIHKAIDMLRMLRDEAKLHLHLATLDAKQEWDEKLEPRVREIEATAKTATEVPRELVDKLESFVARLRQAARTSIS